jgi:hypothetical protein
LIAAGNEAKAFEALLWFGAILVILMAAGAVVFCIRRRLMGSPEDSPGGFTLEDLRGLRDRGEVSRDEYEAMKQKVVSTFGRGKR